ncbi:hypothetical protein ASF66_21720 [Pseudomonas sp. Leaf129]|nr:hypothetical protein ASF66_21720 [Pseudomonas sp. Leaf129]
MTRINLEQMQSAKESYMQDKDRQRNLLDKNSRESWKNERKESKAVMEKQKLMLIETKAAVKNLTQSLANTQTLLMSSKKHLRISLISNLLLLILLIAIVVL